MDRKRDKVAILFGLPGRRRRREEPSKDIRQSGLWADLAPHCVGSGAGARTEAEYGNESPRSLWQRAWTLLPLSDQRLIEIEVPNFDAGGDLFGDLERVAAEKSQELYDRHWNGRERPPGKETETIRLRAVTSRIITCLRRFKEVGDIAISFDPTHAALPWAVIRFLLEAITVDNEQLGLLMSGLERVVSVGLRINIYEKLYLPHDGANRSEVAAQLERALIPLCKDILAFLTMAFKRLRKNTTARAMDALFNPSAVSELLDSINLRSNQAEAEASNCEHFLNLEDRKKLHNLATEDLINIDAKIEEMWVRMDEEERGKVLQWLSPIHYASDHEFARRGRVGDTGSWLLRREEFKQWEQSSVSQIFWLHGIPGAGKTKLSSKVVDDTALHLDESRKETLVYFYCDRNRSDHKDPESILRSFVRQLSAGRDNAQSICKIVDEKWRQERGNGFPSKELPFDICREFLPRLIAAHAKTTMVVDGLDECDRETRHKIIHLLDDIVNDPGYLVKILISSRNDRDLVNNYISRTRLQVQAYDNTDDITTYVLAQLANTSNSWFHDKLSPSLRDTILETFAEKSDGMFQWAVLQMNGLLQLKRAHDIESYLGSLPKGLQKTYQKILEGISGQEGSGPVIAARAFRWIMDSDRALSPDELAAAVCQAPDGLVNCDPDVDIEFVLESCHNLVVVTDHSCRFSHLSVQEYLERHEWPNRPDDHLLGAVCLQLLMASQDIFARHVLNDYAAKHWHRHFTDCDPDASETKSSISPLLARFLGHPTNSSDYYRRWANNYLPKMRSKLLQPSDSAAFGAVLLGLLVTVARWIDNDTLNPNLSSPRRSLLHLAVKSRNFAMCSRLIRAGADVNCANKRGETPIMRAVLKRDYSIVELLVKQSGIDIDKGRDRSGTRALHRAVCLEDAKIVELLLNAGANPNLVDASPSSRGADLDGLPPALHFAAFIGSVDVLRILLHYKADPNFAAGVYGTPLQHARTDAARDCLIEYGADPSFHRTEGRPREVTRELLEWSSRDTYTTC